MMLCAKFGWNWPTGSGEEDENVKSLQQQWRQRLRWTTDGLRLMWAKKLYQLYISKLDSGSIRLSSKSF